MSHPATLPAHASDAASTTLASAAEPPLRGAWLLVGRIGWVTLTLLILALSAISIPHANALYQSICQPGATCADVQLTLADLSDLHRLGLTPSFLATYQLVANVSTLLIYTLLASLIFWRRSSDRMALFCAYMLILTGGATYTTLLDVGLRPLAQFWYWPVGVLELMGLVSMLTFFLLFPRGQFAPRWTRWVTLAIVLAEGHYVFFTDQLRSNQNNSPSDFISLVVLILILVGVQIYRYRRVSTFRERQQTKWVVFGCSLAFLGFAMSFFALHLLFPAQTVQSPIFQALALNTISDGFLLLIPISIAIAILRSRLYDIDTIISRTLVYGLLTGLLGSLYAAIVGLASLVGTFTGQTDPNPLVLVISTLVIAVLALPARRRIQSLIDRRFYRRKYDAAKTLAGFSATLRQEVDLEQLCAQVLAVTEETMQPTHVSLWLRASRPHHAGTPVELAQDAIL